MFKKILISACALFLSLSVLAGPVSAQQSPLPSNRETIVEKAYVNRLTRYDTNEKIPKLLVINTRINNAIVKTNQQWVIDVLQLIQQLVIEDVEKLSDARPITDTTQPQNNNTIDNSAGNNSSILPNYQVYTSNYSEGVRVYEGGDKGALISRYDFTAQREPFWIDELTIRSNRQLDSIIESITIFDEQGVILGKTTVSGNEETISVQDYLLEQGQTDFYMIADFYTMGDNKRGFDTERLSLSVAITESRGRFSGDERVSSAGIGDEVIITPLKIQNYSFTQSFQGYRTDTIVTQNAINTLGILTFETGENDNNQVNKTVDAELDLDHIEISVSTNLQGTEKQALLDSMQLERIDRNFGTINGTINGDTVIFKPSASGSSFGRIEQNQIAGFAILATPPSSSQNTSIQVTIRNLGDGGVQYSAVGSSRTVDVLDGGSYQISAQRIDKN